jgi:ribosomal peptide maturation radical SAM protein 1
MLVSLETQKVSSSVLAKPIRALNVALVNMPFASSDRPSIQCGLLAATLQQAGHNATTHHLNLEFASQVGPDSYAILADNRWQIFLGEWLFSGEAFGVRADYDIYFDECKVDRYNDEFGFTRGKLIALRDEAVPKFLDSALQSADWSSYDVVGFTCTFDQQIASFAFARKLKDRFPHLKTLFGGATFDQETASEFVAKLSWVDYIIVGEADKSIALLAAALAAGEVPHGTPGLVRKSGDGRIACEAPQLLQDMAEMPDPDYSEYFATIDRLGRTALAPRGFFVPFQSARGCWWGAKHHCTFCSLKDSEMFYRSRAASNVVDELVRQSSRYKLLTFMAVDSILDLRYIDTLFPALEDRGLRASFFYEVKANLTREQLKKLSRGGVKILQPGIESLSTRVLQIMKKGTNKLLNIRFLKWAKYYNLNPTWNLLTGFPGERIEDYEEQIALLPLLHYLRPPNDAGIIFLEKHGPYVVNDDPWYRNRRPLKSYSHLFPKNLFDIDRVALYFDSEPEYEAGIPEAFTRLKDGVDQWKAAWSPNFKPSLVYQRGADWSRVVDLRRNDMPREHWLDELQTGVLIACEDTAATPEVIARFLLEKCSIRADKAQIERVCGELTDLSLFVEEDNRFLALPLPSWRSWQ